MSDDELRGRSLREQTWPEPGTTRFRVALEDADGDACRHFQKGGPVEVVIVASEQPVDAAGRDGYQYVLMPLAFPNYPIARTHAEGLGIALGSLERAIERARQAASTPIPTIDDGHRHVVRFARYARALPWNAMCEVCMEELVDDVRAWAFKRGLIEDTFLEQSRPPLDLPTLKTAIENVVNRIGEQVEDG